MLLINEWRKKIAQFFAVSAIAQFVLVIASPALTRIYTPAEFGIWGVISAMTSILSVVCTGRFELAIMLPRSKKKAMHIVVLAVFFSVIINLLCLLLLTGVKYYKSSFPFELNIENFYYVVPVISLCQAIYQIFYHWLNREQRYTGMARSRVLLAATMVFCSFLLGAFPNISGGLIISQFLAYLVAILYLIKTELLTDLLLLKTVTISLLRGTFKQYLDFPRFLIFAHLLEACSTQAPILMLNVFFSNEGAGFFILAQRVISTPISTIGKAGSDIIRGQFSFFYREQGSCIKQYRKYFLGLVLVSLMITVPLFFLSLDIFPLVFGDEWVNAGLYAKYLCFMMAIQFVASPLSVMYSIAEKQKEELFLQLIRIFASVGSIYFGYSFWGLDTLAILCFSLAMCCVYLIMLYQTWKWSKGNKQM